MPVFESSEILVREVRADVEAAFAEALPGEFAVAEPFGDLLPIGEGEATALPWRWRGTHTGVLGDVRPTGLPVDFTGVTLVRRDGGELLFHRIVDWHTLFRQMGFLMVCRRPRLPGTEDADTIDIPEELM